jgi:hypothetical protein
MTKSSFNNLDTYSLSCFVKISCFLVYIERRDKSFGSPVRDFRLPNCDFHQLFKRRCNALKKFIGLIHLIKSVFVGLFLNTLSHVQADIFSGPCHGVSSVCHICPVIGFDTMKKFMDLTHLIKLVFVRLFHGGRTSGQDCNLALEI